MYVYQTMFFIKLKIIKSFQFVKLQTYLYLKLPALSCHKRMPAESNEEMKLPQVLQNDFPTNQIIVIPTQSVYVVKIIIIKNNDTQTNFKLKRILTRCHFCQSFSFVLVKRYKNLFATCVTQ